jgi:uncharacterized protein (DUF2141 family)
MSLRQTLLTSSVLIVLAMPSHAAAPTDAALRIEISGLRNTRGDAGCLLFNSADGYPESHPKAYREQHARIEQGAAVCEFKDIAPGTYAAIVWHDENLNGRMDKNFLGLPQEGYVATNNVRPAMSAPKFKDASFAVTAGTPTSLAVQIGY